MSTTKQVYERFRDLLKTEFKIKELGKPKHILGVRVEFVKNGISLSQRQCIEEIIRTFSFHKGNYTEGVRYILYLTRDDMFTVSIDSKTQS